MNQRTSIRHSMPKQVLLRQIIVGLLITFVVALLFSAAGETADPLNDQVVVEEVKENA
ncbi:MAG TPA: hypothetical protein VK589_10995 [Chryseolinea sp.]|nr:hypothetical protein [Chryseolinea sp.]